MIGGLSSDSPRLQQLTARRDMVGTCALRCSILLALAASAAAGRWQKRQRELTGTRVLGAAFGGATGFQLASRATVLIDPGGMAVFPVKRPMFTPSQQAIVASAAALGGLALFEAIARQEDVVARGLRRIGLWVCEVCAGCLNPRAASTRAATSAV